MVVKILHLNEITRIILSSQEYDYKGLKWFQKQRVYFKYTSNVVSDFFSIKIYALLVRNTELYSFLFSLVFM